MRLERDLCPGQPASQATGDEPHIPKPVKLAMVDDKEALRTQLLKWAELDSLKRILVSHGSPIEDHPGQALRDLAGSWCSVPRQ